MDFFFDFRDFFYLTDFGAFHMFFISTMKVNCFYYDLKVKVLGTQTIKLSSGVESTEINRTC